MTENTMDKQPEEEQKEKDDKPQQSRRRKKKLLLAGILLFCILLPIIWYFYITSDVPQINTITDYKPSVVTDVYGDDGSVIGEFFLQRRIPVSLDQMAKYVPEAFIAAEDATFYQHGGVDYEAI